MSCPFVIDVECNRGHIQVMNTPDGKDIYKDCGFWGKKLDRCLINKLESISPVTKPDFDQVDEVAET